MLNPTGRPVDQRRKRGMGSASALTLAAALALGGCATVQSDHIEKTAGLSPKAAGMTYFLPRRLVKLTATSEPSSAPGAACVYGAKMELLPAEPDVNHRFVARLRHNWLRDDTVKLKVSPAGLLTSANIVAADRTADIIVEIAGIIGLAGGAPGSIGPQAMAPGGAPGCEPRTIIEIFDPAAKDVESTVNRKIANGSPFRLKIEDAPTQLDSSDETVAKALSGARQGALFYRSPAPMKLMLTRDFPTGPEGAMQTHIVDAAIVMVPQAGPVSFVPANSSAFVKTVDDVTFVDGAIASWDPTRPSEILEVVRIPFKVVSAMVSVPTQFLKLKFDYSSQAKGTAAAQVAEIAAQRDLVKLKACIDAAGADSAALNACFAPK